MVTWERTGLTFIANRCVRSYDGFLGIGSFEFGKDGGYCLIST